MWTRKFWADLLERAVKAAGWSLLATLGADATGTISGVDWVGAVNVAAYAFAIAVLGGLVVGSQVGAGNSASWLPETEDPPAPRRKRKP